MIKNKRGLSTVVATLLIIFLTVGATALLASFLVPWVRSNLASDTECTSLREYFIFDETFKYNCRSSSGDYGMVISANTPRDDISNVGGFLVVMESPDGSAKSFRVMSANATSSGEGGIRMLNASKPFIEIPSRGEVRTYVYNSPVGDLYDQIRIQPIIKTQDGFRECAETDSIKIKACTETVPF